MGQQGKNRGSFKKKRGWAIEKAGGQIKKGPFASTALRSVSSLKLAENLATESRPKTGWLGIYPGPDSGSKDIGGPWSL